MSMGAALDLPESVWAADCHVGLQVSVVPKTLVMHLTSYLQYFEH